MHTCTTRQNPLSSVLTGSRQSRLAFSRLDLHDCGGVLSANERVGATEPFSTARSNEPLRSDCKVVRAGEAGLEKAFAAHRPDSRGNIVERVLSLDAHVHYHAILTICGRTTFSSCFVSDTHLLLGSESGSMCQDRVVAGRSQVSGVSALFRGFAA